jgi:TetR/AcrR family transcriptional repressor of mexCD-oprJ operon
MAGSSPPARAPRADSQRNRAAILDAAALCLRADPAASMQDVARAAGVGRVTLYTHFPSRAELLDAVFAAVVIEAEQTLAAVDLGGDEAAALDRLIRASWRTVDRFRLLLHAAQRELPGDRIREHHHQALGRVQQLLDRGRAAGTLRADLPTAWMVSVFYQVTHGAAEEITAGRIAEDAAADLISTTLLAAFTPR